MSDDEFDGLIHALRMDHRRKVVRSLLAGNDVQCFTTEQYAEAYHRICHHDDPNHRDGWIKWLITLAPQHLRSVGMVEISKGIWKELGRVPSAG